MKTILALALLAFGTNYAFADCRSDLRSCTSSCAWQHAACDIPNSYYCISENRRCVENCYADFKCTTVKNSNDALPAPPPIEEATQSPEPYEHEARE